MKIPSTQKVRIEDFPDQKDWIAPLVSVVNKFIQDTIASVNNGLEFSDNFMGLDKELDFVFVSSTVSFPQVFRWTLAKKPNALTVVSAYENTPTVGRDFLPIIACVSWSLSDSNEISISDVVKLDSSPAVSALTVGNRYKIKVRVQP